MSDFQIRVEVSTPRRVRVPDQQAPRVYSGRDVQAWLMVPAEDGYKPYPSWIKDTPEGRHEHQKEQANILGEDPPTHPLAQPPPETEYWQLSYKVGGNERQYVRGEANHWGRKEFLRSVKEDLAMRLTRKSPAPYQIVFSQPEEARA